MKIRVRKEFHDLAFVTPRLCNSTSNFGRANATTLSTARNGCDNVSNCYMEIESEVHTFN